MDGLAFQPTFRVAGRDEEEEKVSGNDKSNWAIAGTTKEKAITVARSSNVRADTDSNKRTSANALPTFANTTRAYATPMFALGKTTTHIANAIPPFGNASKPYVNPLLPHGNPTRPFTNPMLPFAKAMILAGSATRSVANAGPPVTTATPTVSNTMPLLASVRPLISNANANVAKTTLFAGEAMAERNEVLKAGVNKVPTLEQDQSSLSNQEPSQLNQSTTTVLVQSDIATKRKGK